MPLNCMHRQARRGGTARKAGDRIFLAVWKATCSVREPTNAPKKTYRDQRKVESSKSDDRRRSIIVDSRNYRPKAERRRTGQRRRWLFDRKRRIKVPTDDRVPKERTMRQNASKNCTLFYCRVGRGDFREHTARLRQEMRLDRAPMISCSERRFC